MARPSRLDWFTWSTCVPSSTTLIACLFLPQFRDCQGREKTAFQTSTAPMMIAIAVIGLMPIVWRLFPRVLGGYEDVAGMCGTLVTFAFIACFPLVGVFSKWHNGAYFTWGAAWFELGAMITWTTAATSRSELHSATRARAGARSAPLDPSA